MTQKSSSRLRSPTETKTNFSTYYVLNVQCAFQLECESWYQKQSPTRGKSRRSTSTQHSYKNEKRKGMFTSFHNLKLTIEEKFFDFYWKLPMDWWKNMPNGRSGPTRFSKIYKYRIHPSQSSSPIILHEISLKNLFLLAKKVDYIVINGSPSIVKKGLQ